MVPRKSTAEEVSFEWSHHRISSTDSKVRTTLHVSIIESGCKRLTHTIQKFMKHSLGIPSRLLSDSGTPSTSTSFKGTPSTSIDLIGIPSKSGVFSGTPSTSKGAPSKAALFLAKLSSGG